MPIAAWIKSASDRWTQAAGVTEGRIFRRMNRHGKITGQTLSDEGVSVVVAVYARRLQLARKAHARSDRFR